MFWVAIHSDPPIDPSLIKLTILSPLDLLVAWVDAVLSIWIWYESIPLNELRVASLGKLCELLILVKDIPFNSYLRIKSPILWFLTRELLIPLFPDIPASVVVVTLVYLIISSLTTTYPGLDPLTRIPSK